jgi:RHS repeat-associated protein
MDSPAVRQSFFAREVRVKRLSSFLVLLCGLTMLVAAPARAQSEPFSDARVQAPQLAAPQRGSLVGQYAQTAFGPSDVARGTFSLPSPFSAPEDRGPLLAHPFPSYSPEGGLSEWGMGWNAALTLYRWRARGELDYSTDDLNGPWGRMVRGTDGAWYSSGLTSFVRVLSSGSTLVAYLPDGSRWTFGADVRVDTPLGTYSWYLQEVVTVEDRRAQLTYAINATGRPFLQTVSYGGRGSNFQYRLAWVYQPLAQPYLDYRSGTQQLLDQRVQQVIVSVRHAATGAWAERWRSTLNYDEDDAGPGFHLAQVQQKYVSGEVVPPTHFDYYTAAEALSAASFQHVPVLDAPIATFGEDVIQPAQTTLLDSNLDGRPDLEDRLRGTLLVQQGSSFLSEELPPRTPSTVNDCRPDESIYNPPRQLAQMWAASEAYQVVAVRSDGIFANTEVTVCDRNGELLGSQSLASGWGLGANTRLVDLNRDRQPDLIRVYPGGYEILPNTSTGMTFSLGATRSGELAPLFTPDTTWIQDINGDGLADIISRFDTGFVVWYGKGGFEFDPDGQTFPVHLWYGSDLTGLLDYQLVFADVNRDGLTDLMASQAGFSAFFLNTGTDFAETNFPAQDFFGGSSSPVVVADFAGTGGTQLTTVMWGRAYAATLDAPGTGLLRSADDGKGTVLRLSYQWSAPTVGARQRQAVLSDVTLESSGNDPVYTSYSYAEPVLHPDGLFLLGYAHVTQTDPSTTEEVNFLHDANQAGILLDSTTRDARTPGVRQYQARDYDPVVFRGLPWKRLALERKGWASDATSLEESTEYLAYDAEICPSLTVHSTAQGILTTERHRADLPGLSQHLHCLDDREVLTGSHPSPALDFRHEARLTLNAVGLLQKLESVSSDGTITLQEVAYRPDFSIDHVSAPGRGATYFAFGPGGFQLQKVTAPEGSQVEVTERDPLTDSIRTLTSRFGPTAYTQSFRYDGQERLSKQWDSLGAATEANPAQSLAYKYANALEPAAVHVTTLVQAQPGAARQAVEWSTAAGEAVVTAHRIPEGWAFGTLSRHSRNLLETRTYTRPTAPATLAPDTLTHAQLVAGAQLVGSVRAAGFGHDVEAVSKLHADVEQQITTSLSLVPGGLEYASLESGTHRTLRLLDAAGHVVMSEDEAHTRHVFEYDALGRLRSVLLPDGKRHSVMFDGHGRVVRVEREGVAAVEYEYDSVTGLLRFQDFLSAEGVAQRSEEWTYDAIGRKTAELHTDLETGEAQQYRFFYDGATPDAPAQRTHLGVLSAVEGDGYRKTFEYRADGEPSRRVLRLDGWRTVETSFTYAEDNEVAEETTSVRDADGVLLSTSSKQQAWDAYGRLSAVRLNGTGLATFGYDANGLLTSATFASGGSVTLGYDPLTRCRTSLAQATPAWSAATGVRFNPRGFLDHESFTVGGTSLRRQYAYSPQGFLASATDAENAYVYEFDASGLPTAIQEQGVRKELVTEGSTLTAGAVTYTFDALGRTIRKGDLTFFYGPNGHLARAVRGSDTWRFLHDESGQRLLKLSGTTPVAAYLGQGSLLDASGLVEPFRFGGQVVGTVKAGAFQMLATDARGTRIADSNGTARLASPFGNRETYPDNAAVLDYVQQGFDADLGLIRMGVRDYDPELNRFLTPDPLFLEEPEHCAGRPQECNLYSYAGGNPVVYVDPSGEAIDTIWDVASFGAGVYSISQWDKNTSFWAKAMDVAGVAMDGVAMVVPFVPGGVGALIKGVRTGDKAVQAVQTIEKAEQVVVAVEKTAVATEKAVVATEKAIVKAEKTAAEIKAAEKTGGAVGVSTEAAGGAGRGGTKLKPDPGAQGPHSTFKRDPQTGRVTGHAEWDAAGNPVKRTDVTGAAHGPVGTPHTHEYGPPNVNPATGRSYPGNEVRVRPATPEEIPR